LLIIFLALTGFEIHNSYELFGFHNAVKWHNTAAWAFLVLIVFAIFWHFTTGEWRQYLPTTKFLKEQIDYYITGIFRGAPHPTKKTVYNKFNPLQRFVYLGLKILIIPVQVITGFLYLYHNYPDSPLQVQTLGPIALIHTLGAFALMAFVIAHVYLTTTGNKPTSNIKAMITGWEELEEVEAISNEQVRETIENSAAGYYFIDQDGRLRNVNQAWLNMYKYKSKEEISGQHYANTRSKEELPQLKETVERVLQNGESVSDLEVKRLNKDGTEGYHLLTANPVWSGDKIVGMEGFVVDMTERKLSQQQLEARKKELEEVLKSRNQSDENSSESE